MSGPEAEQVIEGVLRALSTVAGYLGTELRGIFGRFLGAFREIYGMDTVQVGLGVKGGKRYFAPQVSLTELSYSQGNHMVNALGGLFPITGERYPMTSVNLLECYPGSGDLGVTSGLSAQSGDTIEVLGGAFLVEEGAFGVTTCLKKSIVKFSSVIPEPQGVGAEEVQGALLRAWRGIREANEDMYREYERLLGFGPGDITVTGNEVMMNTAFDLGLFPRMRNEVERLFRPIIPSGSPSLLGIGILCGRVSEPIFTYDEGESLLIVAAPYQVEGRECLRHALIKYLTP